MKKSRVFGLLLAFLWLCMPIAETVSAVDLSLLGSAMAPQVSDPGFGWGELAAKLDNYSAAYSKAINPVTVGLADAPLNGNGDIGLVMAATPRSRPSISVKMTSGTANMTAAIPGRLLRRVSRPLRWAA